MMQIVVSVEPENVDPDVAAAVVGGEWFLRRMVSADWLKPVYKKPRCTRYALKDVRAAAARMRLEELPELPGRAQSGGEED